MPADVIKLVPEEVGADYSFDAAEILDAAKQKKFNMVMVIGELEDGSIYWASSANFGQTLVLLEAAKLEQIKSLLD